MRYFLFVLPLLPVSVAYCAQHVDLAQNLYSFTGEPNLRQGVESDLLSDSVNNRIAGECVKGASHHKLMRLNIPDLDAHLDRMRTGNLLASKGDMYVLTIPVISGKNRQELAEIVNRRARRTVPRMAVMVDQIRNAMHGHDELTFHLLWSRVMDKMWYRTWQHEGWPGKGPPFANWIIFPEHPVMVGTASYDGAIGGGSIAKSWSH